MKLLSSLVPGKKSTYIYETEKDLSRERSVGEVLAKVWKAELQSYQGRIVLIG